MPITPSITAQIRQRSAVTLSRYAQIIEKDECAFWGVFNAPNQVEEDCGYIWTKIDRKTISKYLAEAQEEIERRLRFPLSPKWITGLVQNQRFGDIDFVDTQKYLTPLLTRWGRIIEGGIYLETEIEDEIPVANKANDPYVITTTVAVDLAAEPIEIHLYHEQTDDEITPSSIVIDPNTGIVTIEVPRCRTVKPELSNSPELDYAVLTNFMDKGRVTWARTDPSVNANIVKHSCNGSCAPGCSETTQSGCINIIDGEIGHVTVRPATFNGTEFVSSSASCRFGSRLRLNYRAGTHHLSAEAEDAIVRLAHSKMPDEPCNCAQGQRLWKRDRFVPLVLTAQRLNCPFGLNDGAWISWMFASDMKNITMTVF